VDSVPAVLCAVALAECLTAAGDVAAAERLLSESVPVRRVDRPCRFPCHFQPNGEPKHVAP
jgi:hypothetical protein